MPYTRTILKFSISPNDISDFTGSILLIGVLEEGLPEHIALIENKLNKKKDIIIYVDAKQNLINKRLRERSNYNKKLLQKFKKIQLKSNLKKKKSNYKIANNFNSQVLKKAVNNLKFKILRIND